MTHDDHRHQFYMAPWARSLLKECAAANGRTESAELREAIRGHARDVLGDKRVRAVMRVPTIADTAEATPGGVTAAEQAKRWIKVHELTAPPSDPGEVYSDHPPHPEPKA